jgi:hypothetical protein
MIDKSFKKKKESSLVVTVNVFILFNMNKTKINNEKDKILMLKNPNVICSLLK